MAVSSPQREQTVNCSAGVSAPFLKVAWSVIGSPVESFSISVDGTVVKRGITSTEEEIGLTGLSVGSHTLTVTAEGAVTRFPLSYTGLDEPLESGIPLKVDVPFSVV
jgi:hypothetical protein